MNEHVSPYSLFAAQLEKRLGRDVSRQCRVMERNTNASSSPTIEEAMQMAKEALKPRQTLLEWIEMARLEDGGVPAQLPSGNSRQSGQSALSGEPNASISSYVIRNGWLTKDGTVLVGGKHQTPWWNGRTTDAAMSKAKFALTRFVPGQEGTGGTDRIDSVVAEMQRNHKIRRNLMNCSHQ
jgi:hypothetical protein